MTTFSPEKSQSNVDFLAFSVARMEIENSDISAQSVASTMPQAMADTFFERLNFYRQQLQGHTDLLTDQLTASAAPVTQ